jgi:hypothetical protein
VNLHANDMPTPKNGQNAQFKDGIVRFFPYLVYYEMEIWVKYTLVGI